MYKWYYNGMLKNDRRQIKQWAVHAKLHVGVVLIFCPSNTSRSLKIKLLCEFAETKKWHVNDNEISTGLYL